MSDPIRPPSRPRTPVAALAGLAFVALVAFSAGCTSPSASSGAVVPVAAASGGAVPLPGVQAPEPSSGWTDKPGWTAQHFMIAAANPLAAQAGYDMLKAGGTKRHKELLAPFGLNAADPAFWSKGLGVIAGFIDELEQMG